MAQRIPPALEEEIRKLDNMQRQYQSFQVMAQTLQNELNEVKATLEELRKESDDTITYKTVGQVMFKVEKLWRCVLHRHLSSFRAFRRS
ncbi:MAG: prefoldin subunit [Candidatus Thorarchaeota archaeon]|jgi:chaperonin cofactor prefoldin